MSSSLKGAAPADAKQPILEGLRVAIVTAQWNSQITHRLEASALETFKRQGYDLAETVDTYSVPGAVELTYAASQLIEASAYDAVIVFGCVIRGDTPHFDYVCQSVTQGITSLNADVDTPVIFGLLTVENLQQALDRTGDPDNHFLPGPAGDKGAEAALAAIQMAAFTRRVKDL